VHVVNIVLSASITLINCMSIYLHSRYYLEAVICIASTVVTWCVLEPARSLGDGPLSSSMHSKM
jgi:hypothetical protein